MPVIQYDTGNMARKAGIEKIVLPLRASEVTLDTVKEWLPLCLAVQARNAAKIAKYEAFVSGAYQPVMSKERAYKSSSDVNNRIVENHAAEIVAFKEGFLLGDRKQFTQKEDFKSDDLVYLNRYLDDVNFATKDLEIRHNVYATGIGTSFVQPRVDILTDSGEGARFLTAQEGYDIVADSPFVYECVDSKRNAVVYSSFIGQKGLGDLFCFNVCDVLDKNGASRKVITVWTRKETYVFNDWGKVADDVTVYPATSFGELPMVEHSLNAARVGTIELCEDLLNAVNTLISASVDNVVDTANQLLVFVGCVLEDGDIEDLYKKGAILLPPSPNGNPDVKTLNVDLKYSEVNVLFEQILTRLYDIAAVPLASASVSSGNNEAAYLGGGWTHAYNAIKRDVLYFEAADRELLKKWLKICRLNSESPVDEVSAQDIEIKYNINQSNNLINKTQSLQNLVDANLPYEDILKAVGIWGDVHTVAERWQENVDRLKKDQALESKAENAPSAPYVEPETADKVAQTIGAEANIGQP